MADNNTKVTAYDFANRNPFERITHHILQNSRFKVDVHSDRASSTAPTSLGFLHYLKTLWYGTESSETGMRINALIIEQINATDYSQWVQASLELDNLEGNDKWKLQDESDLYDYQALAEQLDELRYCRENGQYERILYIIRTTWKRDIFGINNQELYKFSHIGTKKLIEDYIKECDICLMELASPNCPINDQIILDTLIESKRNYGRTAITMSGGGSFGLIGIGLFSTLLENEVFPKIVSGSSGGSIVSSIICSMNSDEVIKVLSSLFDNKFQVFSLDDDPDTFYTHLSRFLKYGVWFDSKYLQTTMQKFLGDITFKEAYNKTGRILNITVSSASMHDQPTLLNYLTAPNVLVWSAVCASCSLPFVFPSSAIYERNIITGEIDKWSNPSLKFVDGSLNSDLPISRLSEMFNVNHVIACQVNPHITPLVKFAADCLDVSNSGLPWKFKRYAFKLASLATQETIHYMDLLKEFGICENLAKKVKQLLMQSYSGDITILPDIKSNELEKTLSNPTPSFIWECILNGARSTWPKLSLIKDQLTLEFSMDKFISVIKSRIVFDNKDLYGMPVIKGVRSSSSMYGLSEKKRRSKGVRASSNYIPEDQTKNTNKYSPSKTTNNTQRKVQASKYRNKKENKVTIDDTNPNHYRNVENESPFGNKYVDIHPHNPFQHQGQQSQQPQHYQVLQTPTSDQMIIPSTYSYYDIDDTMNDPDIKRSALSTQSLSGLISEQSPRKVKRVLSVSGSAGVGSRIRSNSTTFEIHQRRASGGSSGKGRIPNDLLTSPRSAGSVLYNRKQHQKE